MLKVLSDVLIAVDHDDPPVLMLLDLSAAFDTVDHVILLRRCRHKMAYGLENSVIECIVSYLKARIQYVCCGSSRSAPVDGRLLWGPAAARLSP